MVIFKRKPFTKPRTITQWPGVSIIIAHRNDSAHLEENLQAISGQNYPLFEVIIVDDHSSTFEKNNLEKIVDTLDGVRILSSPAQGKKNALIFGIQSAQFELILCTDADCKPVSDQWIRKMVESGKPHEIVLGYSPCQKRSGWRNLLIRFETMMTAIQYMSWAMTGKPYMGVGRNLLFPRKLFLDKEPYKTVDGNPYGDDDLWVQALSAYVPSRVSDDPASFVETLPPGTWKQWFKQKHRHMSAGHYYSNKRWWQPGIYGMALILHWALVPVLIMCSFWWRWIPVFMIALIIRWISYHSWTQRLGDRDTIPWYPLLEINYAMYLGFMGLFTLIRRKKAWN